MRAGTGREWQIRDWKYDYSILVLRELKFTASLSSIAVKTGLNLARISGFFPEYCLMFSYFKISNIILF
jgi:hypothetical protein